MNDLPPIIPLPKLTPPKPAKKRNPWITPIILLVLVVVGGYALLPDLSCLSEPYTCFKFGNYGGGQQRAKNKSIIKTYGEFKPQMTQYGIRWFPTYVHFGPDGDTLLVSLCHVQSWRQQFCRIGKYSIAKNHWDILPFKEDHTYLEPVFSPDGQWIVTTMAETAEGMPISRTLRLVKMKPDGTGVQDLISTGLENPAMNVHLEPNHTIQPGNDIQATGATFSHNGKRLIYWRQFNLRVGGPAFARLFLMDWETGKETLLAGDSPHFSRNNGRPFLTPDGERFVFSVEFSYGLGPEEKEFIRGDSLYIGNVKDAPVIQGELIQKLQKLSYLQGWATELQDMDRQGRVLYMGNLMKKKEEGNPVALSIRPGNPDYKYMGATPYPRLTEEEYRSGKGLHLVFNRLLNESLYTVGKGYAFFLREPHAEAQDEVAFDGGSALASVSPDSQTLAFIWSGRIAGFGNGISLLRQGEPMRNTRFIDWPKLDLIPTQPNSSPKP